jgi:hypothetical protein
MRTAQAIRLEDAHDYKPATDPDAAATPSTADRIAIDIGIHSTDPVVDGHETLEAWLSHRDAVVDQLNPVGSLETAYARRAALFMWRLDRVIRYENSAARASLEDVIQDFIVSLDDAELLRDRSEMITLEKVRKPLVDFLDEFAKWGADARKNPDQKDGLTKIRTEAKRIRERRIIPDDATLKTIIKYEAHLDRCLVRTLAELRRLQKERRQGLRSIEERERPQPPAQSTPSASVEEIPKSEPLDSSSNRCATVLNAPESPARSTPPPPDFQSKTLVRSFARASACVEDVPDSESFDSTLNRGIGALNAPEASARSTPPPPDFQSKTPVRSFARASACIEEVPDSESFDSTLNRGIGALNAHEASARSTPRRHLERMTDNRSSDAPIVVVRSDPIALETHLHQKE